MDNINENGVQEPINLVKDIPEDRETAIIDLVTLQRLAHNLAGAGIEDIIKNFVDKLTAFYMGDSTPVINNMEKYTKLLDDESAFHKTVDAIIEYGNVNTQCDRDGNELDELCEAMHKDGKT